MRNYNPIKYYAIDNDFPPEHDEQQSYYNMDGVESFGNEIYYYGFIEPGHILKLTKLLRSKECELLRVYDSNTPPPIKLYIQSLGGDFFAAMGAMDIIRNLKVPVHTIISGVAASGATFLSLAGTRRYITEHSFAMMHQLSSVVDGDYENIKDKFSNITKFMEIIENIYKEFTKISPSKLQQLLKHDLYFSAIECLKYGMVDEIWK